MKRGLKGPIADSSGPMMSFIVKINIAWRNVHWWSCIHGVVGMLLSSYLRPDNSIHCLNHMCACVCVWVLCLLESNLLTIETCVVVTAFLREWREKI